MSAAISTGGYGAGNPNFSGAAGGLGSLIAAFLMGQGKYNNPANSAMPYLNQIQGTLQQGYDPYVNAGLGAMGNYSDLSKQMTSFLPQLQGALGSAMSSPGQFINTIGQNFQQSPGYQFQVNQAENAAKNAAAAGGMLGSPQQQQGIAGTVNQLANQDYYGYLNEAMGAFGKGVEGSQNLVNTGFQGFGNIMNQGYNASNEMAQSLANALQSQGSLAYAGQANKNQYQQAQQGGIAGLVGGGIASILPYLATL